MNLPNQSSNLPSTYYPSGLPFVNDCQVKFSGRQTLAEKMKTEISAGSRDPELKAGLLARKIGVTINRLGELVKLETGMSFKEYLNSVRLEDAKLLLTQTSMSVSDIAYIVGYEYPQSFTRVFRQYLKQSPTEFRKEKATTLLNL